jgi:energy-coupling factor transporter ATP-binding protein EcfA2
MTETEVHVEFGFKGIIGQSNALRRVLSDIEIVAPADSTVLIHGETGTGKELIARAVRDLSARKANSFIRFNCAAIPTGLLESELFGHEKGALREQLATGWVVSSWRIAGRCSWMKSERSPWSFSRSSCVCFRSANSSAWEARARFDPTLV